MLIPAPKYDPVEDRTEDSPEVTEEKRLKNNEWIRTYLDCKNWKCPACRSTVFGRALYCPYCKNRSVPSVITPRPADWSAK